MEKIRILHCLETIGSGGVEQLRYNLSRYLDKGRFEQKIICTKAIGVLPERMAEQGMEVIPVGIFHSPFHIDRYRKVLKVIREYKPHIVHGAVFEGLTMGTVAGWLARVPVIIIEETADPVDRTWRGDFLMRLFARLSDKVVAESQAAGEYVRSVVRVKEPRLQVINNGVDIPLYPDERSLLSLKESLGIVQGDFVVGSVGRLLDSHKRVSDLIRAVALLKERNVLVKLLIVGDGPDREALRQLCLELGVRDTVIFAGYQGDTAPYFACMDLFALASQMEAFGLVLVEAMLFKLPVVATAVGGIKQVVVNGKTGLLVDKNSPNQLSDAIADLYGDGARRKAFGEAGYQRAMDEYTISLYVSRIDRLYTDLYYQKVS
jgi:glycosyltransferase involved in cell wall biosynthesis